MHRIAAMPGGWDPQSEGVIFIEQTPAPIVLLTAADTDIQTIAQAVQSLPENFPALRVANLLQLQQQLTIDAYAEDVLSQAQVIVVRLLGGRSYWSYGLEVVRDLSEQQGTALFVLPGDDRPDPDLLSHSTVGLSAVNRVWHYFCEGGITNLRHALQYLADVGLGYQYNPPAAEIVPRVGIYERVTRNGKAETTQEPDADGQVAKRTARVGILFYRAHYLCGNLAPIERLCQALVDRHLEPIPLFVSSLRDLDVQADVLSHFQPKDKPAIDLILNTTGFAIGTSPEHRYPKPSSQPDPILPDAANFWCRLNVPALQVILSSGTIEQWQESFQGLSPRDMAMNVALPEVDGRIITRAVSFKAVEVHNPELETDVVGYQPLDDRIAVVADLALNWITLRRTPVGERRIALILANYPNRDGRLANGVGLDTPASCVEILKALQQAGYTVADIPQTGQELIQRLTAGVTNDPEGQALRPVAQALSWETYDRVFATLPSGTQQAIRDRWGSFRSQDLNPHDTIGINANLHPDDRQNNSFAVPGLQLGHIFIGIQPSRGYDNDPTLNYHSPDLEPTHDYLAFYGWLRYEFQAQAIVHIGKHGNLEWLPGKSIALSQQCYPEIALGPLPHFYPFIVNDPGEGSQAKRRAQAVILDHLTPPMTRAELYGSLLKLEQLVDEYYEAQSLDPSRLVVIQAKILTLVEQENLQAELTPLRRGQVSFDENKRGVFSVPQDGLNGENITNGDLRTVTDQALTIVLDRLDSYLCELKEAQIRDGLHIFGQCPQGRPLRDLIVAIARSPSSGRLGFTRAIAQDFGLNFDPLTAEFGTAYHFSGHIAVSAPVQDKDVPPPLAGEHLPVEYCRENGYIPGCRVDNDPPIHSRGQSGEPSYPNEFKGDHTDSNQHTVVTQQPVDLENLQRSVFSQLTTCRTLGDAIEVLEIYAAHLVESLILSLSASPTPSVIASPRNLASFLPLAHPRVEQELNWIARTLLPALQNTDRELTALLQGLDGQYIPAGPSGAPTRGRPEVLPTGRNFYSVDLRGLPTESAWEVGRKAAEALIERYTQEQGEYPQTIGLSVWGTSTMRTGGDDIAEAFALLGVRPIWEGVSRRVIDFEILPLSVLARPRVDVTLRISGFFRDAFPNLIELFEQAVKAVAALDEPANDNPLAERIRIEAQAWQAKGLTWEQANQRSLYRIFGSKPGAYGAGLQGLIEAQNWQTDADLAQAYINWSCYAYTTSSQNWQEKGVQEKGVQEKGVQEKGLRGVSAPDAFRQRLQHLQVVLHNQDNREHDLLDSDDYYQFQGGLTAAVRVTQGVAPQTYFGDHSRPENPKVRHLSAEIARVYRSRVVNPKWIAGVRRHGYKGAFEMAATVDYLFAYDATAQCVEDYMYTGIAEAYVFDPETQAFIQAHNPWALRDMAERLLEAHQRGLWRKADAQILEQLRMIVLAAEGTIETTHL